MKYFYKRPDISVPVYGKPIKTEDPFIRCATLYLEHEKGILVIQKRFDDKSKSVYWGSVDADIANDIYLSPKFQDFFKNNATTSTYPVFKLRTLMWNLRMKPMEKEPWESFFS